MVPQRAKTLGQDGEGTRDRLSLSLQVPVLQPITSQEEEEEKLQEAQATQVLPNLQTGTDASGVAGVGAPKATGRTSHHLCRMLTLSLYLHFIVNLRPIRDETLVGRNEEPLKLTQTRKESD